MSVQCFLPEPEILLIRLHASIRWRLDDARIAKKECRWRRPRHAAFVRSPEPGCHSGRNKAKRPRFEQAPKALDVPLAVRWRNLVHLLERTWYVVVHDARTYTCT